MILDTDFTYRDDLFDKNIEGATTPVEILIDPFKGVVYRYTAIKFNIGKDNIPHVTFEYELIETPGYYMSTLRNDKTFNFILGRILNSILNELDRESNEIRTNNIKESNNEGELY